jgi:hypothetical protein
MDDIVRQAMAKWPNVPHCYGWLALDARGQWRMRDERAQALRQAGERLVHPALVAFINRNYGCDERGCWYFQNGPQRVFVELELAPFVARSDPAQGFVLQTGATAPSVERMVMTDGGHVLLIGCGVVAALDDRDLGALAARLQLDGQAVSEEQLLGWLEGRPGALKAELAQGVVSVERGNIEDVAAQHGFVRSPAVLANGAAQPLD